MKVKLLIWSAFCILLFGELVLASQDALVGQSEYVFSNQIVLKDVPINLRESVLKTKFQAADGTLLEAIYTARVNLEIRRDGVVIYNEQYKYDLGMQDYLSSPVSDFTFDNKGRLFLSTYKIASVYDTRASKILPFSWFLLILKGDQVKVIDGEVYKFDFYRGTIGTEPLVQGFQGHKTGGRLFWMKIPESLKDKLGSHYQFGNSGLPELMDDVTNFRLIQSGSGSEKILLAEFYNPTSGSLISVDTSDGTIIKIVGPKGSVFLKK